MNSSTRWSTLARVSGIVLIVVSGAAVVILFALAFLRVDIETTQVWEFVAAVIALGVGTDVVFLTNRFLRWVKSEARPTRGRVTIVCVVTVAGTALIGFAMVWTFIGTAFAIFVGDGCIC